MAAIDEDLYAALKAGDVELALSLLKAGARPDAFRHVADYGKPPLLLACLFHPDLIDPLIEAGATLEPYYRDASSGRIKSALSFAIEEETGQSIELLLKHGFDFSKHSDALFDAVGKVGLHDNIRRVVTLGVNPNCVRGEHKQTSLHLAAFFGHPKTVQTLLDVGACLDAESLAFSGGATPLMMAGVAGHLKCMKVLLDAGAVVDDRMLSESFWGYRRVDKQIIDRAMRLLASHAMARRIDGAMSSTGTAGRQSPVDPSFL